MAKFGKVFEENHHRMSMQCRQNRNESWKMSDKRKVWQNLKLNIHYEHTHTRINEEIHLSEMHTHAYQCVGNNQFPYTLTSKTHIGNWKDAEDARHGSKCVEYELYCS